MKTGSESYCVRARLSVCVRTLSSPGDAEILLTTYLSAEALSFLFCAELRWLVEKLIHRDCVLG